ncbi:hypothetical protein BSLA_01f3924 [Burkholderia stabilis]|nr:hypothetical protein BSLA_01f3924 [Burkholderia stabilis]
MDQRSRGRKGFRGDGHRRSMGSGGQSAGAYVSSVTVA